MITDMFGSFAPMMPMVIMIIGALVMPALYFITKSRRLLPAASLVVIAASAIMTFLMLEAGYTGTYGSLFTFDAFSGLMLLLFQTVVFLAVLISGSSIETTRMHVGAYYSLLLGATTGMMFVATASDLIAIFVGVEVVSISSYALVAMKRNDPRAAEAAVKYVIIGGLSTALTVYGISLLYGVTGSTNLMDIGAALATAQFSWAFVIAMITMIAGYGFKIAAVPFHMWAPDVYEGAATPVSLFLATGSKKMGLVVFFKIFLILFVVAQTAFATAEIQYVFAIIAAITMTVGNVVAITQTNIKRMLAYSSIAQAGYIMIVLAVMNEYALTGGLFHMFTHVFMKGGAFIVVAALINVGLGERISDYKGLAKRAPLIAFAMMLFLFSLAGIPPLAGFTSKFVLFSAAIYDPATGVMSQWVWLAFIAILNSAISLYYYTKVVKTMYIDKPKDDAEKIQIPKTFMAAMVLCLVFVIVLGVYPQLILDLCANAAAAFF
ncbi:MAG: NADH-quinone oxidoreductase subunit N [Candidatus Methanomethylophilaceae archaeon]|jgi:NADH-quinone oxidoreductase subunit N|nr:NADH-quinone oxidoreductase subunit N [Candidatus Methanomethylophilaceae archaeon]